MFSISSFRLRIIIVSLFLFSGVQSALQADDEFTNFKDCRSIDDKAVRFVCYETFAQDKIFSQKKAEIEQKKAFGTGKKTTIDTMNELTVTIVKLVKAPSGGVIFVTSDNQTWKQKDTRRIRSSKVPFEATIKKKLMGSYSLSPVNSKGGVTVVRLK